MTKDPSLQDETPDVPNEPDSSEVDVAEITEDTGGRKKRAVFDTIVDKLESKRIFLIDEGLSMSKDLSTLLSHIQMYLEYLGKLCMSVWLNFSVIRMNSVHTLM